LAGPYEHNNDPYCVYKGLQPVPVLNRMNQIYIPPFFLSKFHFNIMIQSMLMYSDSLV
jgi:hypothetical protein